MTGNVSTVLNSEQESLFVTLNKYVTLQTCPSYFTVTTYVCRRSQCKALAFFPKHCLAVVFFSHYSVHIQRLFAGLSAEFQMDVAKHDQITAQRETQLNAECPTPDMMPYTLSKRTFKCIRYAQFCRYVKLYSVNVDFTTYFSK